jgi:hypothetical protein
MSDGSVMIVNYGNRRTTPRDRNRYEDDVGQRATGEREGDQGWCDSLPEMGADPNAPKNAPA